MKNIILFSLLSCILNDIKHKLPNPSLGNQLILGTWEYQFSSVDSLNTKLRVDKYLPVEKMIFESCSDSLALQNMPSYVVRGRANNFFTNIKCITFNFNTKIDEYFPVVDSSFHSKSNNTLIFNYGTRYRDEYFIKKIEDDTLIIFNGRIHKIQNKEYNNVNHIYLRTKK